jgi:hypothetical protein
VKLALLAAGAMILQDVFAVVMVQAESKQMGWRAGFMDMCGWLVTFVSLRISITSHGSTEVYSIVFISIANVLGTKLGQVTGKKFLHEKLVIDPTRPQVRKPS